MIGVGPKVTIPGLCILMITKHIKLFGTNQVQEYISGFDKMKHVLPIKEDVDGSWVLKFGFIAQLQMSLNITIREARLKTHVADRNQFVKG